ncbi:NADH-quinone oxidoreductase subunit N [Chryseolinea lacunae]|uniref:NADH-quinone oxidoreductase subunit N n=1 Tax=Chryseolinea lacunae TaxID=2801331 RepID=A0ABS1KZI7_9BACT|nr:NADH-quinone oxidoreductase subunit N [Chryseolinea lacunae]MBL0744881.1 NADH-quinone oxidoreductase subunit N [Chryseolinea lacunae]
MNALLVICGLGFVSLLAEIANFKKLLTVLVILALAAAVVLVVLDWNTSQSLYHDMVVFDNFALGFTGLLCLVTLGWYWMTRDFFENHPHQSDRLALVVFALAGGIIMVSFNNMAMLFLGIEILSISLYVLAGSNKASLLSNEAAFKYFLMGSFATGFLLMGIALVYGATGSFDITKISAHVASHADSLPRFFHAGVLLIFVGMTFKISAVPFHFWAPDVYEGSPTPVTAFMSTVVKTAALAAFFRMFASCFASVEASYHIVLQVIIVLTLVVANVTAVYQGSVKRILAYSSVAHVGYILLAIMSSGSAASGVLFYYMASYSVASIAAFAVLQAVELSSGSTGVDAFNGLYHRNPFLAVVMTIAILSLAGIPPLAGFFGKYLVFAQALQHGYLPFVILGVLTSLIGIYYYFKVLIAMYRAEKEGPRPDKYSTVLLVLLVAAILALGIFPDHVIGLLRL